MPLNAALLEQLSGMSTKTTKGDVSNLVSKSMLLFRVLDERPVDEHEADAVSSFFITQHLPSYCSLVGYRPPHA